MMNNNSKTANGVRTIPYKGKVYVEVAERVRQVHDKKIDFEVIESTYIEIRNRVICKAIIKVDGKMYVGNAEVKLDNAMPKSADATNPFECGETSAVGRALAWAGFGTPDSIASWDEIARGMAPGDLKAGQSPEQSDVVVVESSPVQEEIPSEKEIWDKARSLNLKKADRSPAPIEFIASVALNLPEAEVKRRISGTGLKYKELKLVNSWLDKYISEHPKKEPVPATEAVS